jgi:hypothetical protein
LAAGCGGKEEGAPVPSGEPEGKVERLEGDAMVIRGGEGHAVHLHLGDPLFQGDVMVTEGAGTVEFRLVDGTILTLRPNSRCRINDRGAFEGEAPSVMLVWGRLLSRALTTVGQGRFSVDSPTLTVEVRGTEFEVAVAEDQGAMAAVYHGKVEVDSGGEGVPLTALREVEAEFTEPPKAPRTFKEKTEADWAGWMAARTRDLHQRLPDLAVRMERRVREIRGKRQGERASMEKGLQDLEAAARAMGGGGDGTEAPRRAESIRQFQVLWTAHCRALKRAQQMANRLVAAHAHAERLQRRAKGLKKELGSDRYRRVGESLKRIVEGRKEWQKDLADDRAALREHFRRTREILDLVPEVKAALGEAREREARGASQKEKASPPPSPKARDGAKIPPRSSVQKGAPPAPAKQGAAQKGGGAAGAKSGSSKVHKAPEKAKKEPPVKSDKSAPRAEGGRGEIPKKAPP